MEIKINLIPECKKLEIKKSQSFYFTLKLGIEMLVLAIFFFLAVFSFQKIIDINLSLAENNLDFRGQKNDFTRIEEFDREFEKNNSVLSELEKAQKNQLCWNCILNNFASLVPREITLIGISTSNFKMIIVGIADTRDSLVKFREVLEKEECFKQVNLPLSNLVSKDDVSFQIEFILKEECLKRK